MFWPVNTVLVYHCVYARNEFDGFFSVKNIWKRVFFSRNRTFFVKIIFGFFSGGQNFCGKTLLGGGGESEYFCMKKNLFAFFTRETGPFVKKMFDFLLKNIAKATCILTSEYSGSL